jgi:hypothetical protein
MNNGNSIPVINNNNLPHNYQPNLIYNNNNTLNFQNQPYTYNYYNEYFQSNTDINSKSYSHRQLNTFYQNFLPIYQQKPQQPIIPQPQLTYQNNSNIQSQYSYQNSNNIQNNINSQPINEMTSFNYINKNDNINMNQQINNNYDPTADCLTLYKAMKGFSIDEKAIINLVTKTKFYQRLLIRKKYNELYNKDLIEKINSKLSGNFCRTVKALFYHPSEFDAINLYKAMKGLGTDEEVLIEILGTRNNKQINLIKEYFLKINDKSLEKWVYSDTSGNFRTLLLELIKANRSENITPNKELILKDVNELFSAGEGKWGDCNEKIFIKIFSQRSDKELIEINKEYIKFNGKGLSKIINSKISGDLKKLLNTILNSRINPSAYYAKNIFDSVDGLGTNDKKLIRNIVSRSEIDMNLIKSEYKNMFKNDMLEDVKDDTSGDYRKILCQLINK